MLQRTIRFAIIDSVGDVEAVNTMTHMAKSGVFSSAMSASVAPPLGGRAKRGFDIVAASIAILAITPLLILVALMVKISDRGPILYGHERIGRGGRTFKCLKFRTMALNGDQLLAAHLLANPAARKEWDETRKLKHDPRVTVVGSVLRRLSIDELPQLFNILMGDMSLVGPRPVVLDELDRYGTSAEFYLRSRPGLTGLWQISGRNDVSYDVRVNFDRHYVEHWSLVEDIRIIILTVPAVCLSRGSY
jgi:exopolysaccharide production protein ExoY